MSDFVHLHVHSHFSLLDGGNRIQGLVKQAVEHGMKALALTDHGNLYGAIEFYNTARAAGLKPILGMEAYISPGHRTEKTNCGIGDAASHLLLLAMNETGWRNLIKLSSRAFLEGFYYKPRLDRELLSQFHEGLVCTSACLGGEIPEAFVRGRADEARRIAGEYRDIFGPERFFIEIQNQGEADQDLVNPMLIDLAKEMGLGIVATNDVHFLRRSDKPAHNVLTCISTGKRIDDPNALHYSEELFLKSPAEMDRALGMWPEAIANTARIAEMCDLKLDFSKKHLPGFRTPAGITPEQHLRQLAWEGLARRFGEVEPPPEYRKRLEWELKVIEDKGYSSYFLIVNDFVQFARRNEIPAAPRGSGVATLLGYSLGIANVDPVRYGLLFERFTDPQRKEDPDVDIDICQVGREKVIQYVREKYGHVAQIITYGTLKPRAAIRDVGRVLNWPLDQVDRIAKMIPEGPKATMDLALGLKEPKGDEGSLVSAELKAEYEANPETRKLVDLARSLEGLARHAGVHAAGVVVCDEPLEGLIPLCRQADKPDVITQWDGPTCEKVGLMKMDLLGLKTLSVIQRARELVRRKLGKDVDPDTLPLDDDSVYAMFRAGATDAVFQFESEGMKGVLRDMQPNRIEDLIAANAMYRPGPMELISTYCRRKAGKEPIEKVHPLVDGLLAETLGIMVYQEQVMQVLDRLGGLPLSRALTLIKAISKKKKEVINSERPAFIEGAGKNGIDAAEAERLFELILKFAGYGFNKAHSTGYAIIAYQTAWFKRHHPAEFWAATLTFESNDLDKLGQYMGAAKRDGVLVLPPDINISETQFSVDGDLVRFGMSAVKGVGEGAVEAILAARKTEGKFKDLHHVCRSVDRRALNRSTLEALIRCGAFDRCEGHRAQFLAALDEAMAVAASDAKDRAAGQMSLFGAGAAVAAPPPRLPDVTPWSMDQVLAAERETLGFCLTGHPVDDYAVEVRSLRWPRTLDLAKLESMSDRAPVQLCGSVASVRERIVKKGRTAGRKMAVAEMEDGESGKVEVVLYPDTFERHAGVLKAGRVLVVRGSVQTGRGQGASIAANEVLEVDAVLPGGVRRLIVALRQADMENAGLMEAMQKVFRDHRGRCPVLFQVEATAWALRHFTVEADPTWSVNPSHALILALREVVDARHLSFDPRPVEIQDDRRRFVRNGG
jgi:DNA polymerase-3 subunit alpha